MKPFFLFLAAVISSVLAAEYYDPGKELCCDGVKQGSANRVTSCCGNRTYDVDFEVCCNYTTGEVLQKPETKSKSYSPNYRCCNGKVINDREFLCCENTIVPIPKDNVSRSYYDYSCCGKEVYCTAESTCCIDKLYKNEDSNKYLSCCGNKAYNYDKKLCCGDDILYDKANPDQQCCGKVIYDTVENQCQWGAEPRILPRFTGDGIIVVCNNELYITGYQDKVKPLCCGDTLHYVQGYDLGCCGTQLYNTTDQMCCSNSVKIGNNWVDNAKVYNSPCPNGRMSCSKDGLFDYNKQQICDGKIVDLAPDVGDRKQLCCRQNYMLYDK